MTHTTSTAPVTNRAAPDWSNGVMQDIQRLMHNGETRKASALVPKLLAYTAIDSGRELGMGAVGLPKAAILSVGRWVGLRQGSSDYSVKAEAVHLRKSLAHLVALGAAGLNLPFVVLYPTIMVDLRKRLSLDTTSPAETPPSNPGRQPPAPVTPRVETRADTVARLWDSAVQRGKLLVSHKDPRQTATAVTAAVAAVALLGWLFSSSTKPPVVQLFPEGEVPVDAPSAPDFVGMPNNSVVDTEPLANTYSPEVQVETHRDPIYSNATLTPSWSPLLPEWIREANLVVQEQNTCANVVDDTIEHAPIEHVPTPTPPLWQPTASLRFRLQYPYGPKFGLDAPATDKNSTIALYEPSVTYWPALPPKVVQLDLSLPQSPLTEILLLGSQQAEESATDGFNSEMLSQLVSSQPSLIVWPEQTSDSPSELELAEEEQQHDQGDVEQPEDLEQSVHTPPSSVDSSNSEEAAENQDPVQVPQNLTSDGKEPLQTNSSNQSDIGQSQDDNQSNIGQLQNERQIDKKEEGVAQGPSTNNPSASALKADKSEPADAEESGGWVEGVIANWPLLVLGGIAVYQLGPSLLNRCARGVQSIVKGQRRSGPSKSAVNSVFTNAGNLNGKKNKQKKAQVIPPASTPAK